MPITSASWDMVDMPMCMKHTRIALLSDIWSWVESPSDPVVYWLNGLAGTGKSTVARTLCRRLADNGLLGASFFINRQRAERRDASNIVRSIAYQLTRTDASVAELMCMSLRDCPELPTGRPIHQQVSDLIFTPAQGLPVNTGLVIVIDALDECFTDARGHYGGEMLPLLVRALLGSSRRLKLFITSRVENTIQLTFDELSSSARHIVTKLHDLDRDMVERDIRTYLTGSFSAIAVARRNFDLSNWPSEDDIHDLVQRSQVLFVYASTVVRFVGNHQYDPRSRLDILLARRGAEGTSPYRLLDQLYTQVLVDTVATQEEDEDVLCHRLRKIIGAIVFAQYPLRIDSLGALLEMDISEVRLVVEQLSAFLLFGPDEPVRIFHPSFPDFITDPRRCKDARFLLSSPIYHGDLAYVCLVFMNRELRYDICGLHDPSIANADVPDLESRCQQRISEQLQYASRSWFVHAAASTPNAILLRELNEFCRKHLLHWIEILSLIGCLSSATDGLPRAIAWYKVR
jgi:hypothetical protein